MKKETKNMYKNLFYSFLLFGLIFFSCAKEKKQGDLLEIPIDIDQNNSLLLSEIAEEITAIELELTDESLINPDYINRIIISENDIIIASLNNILVFNKDGKFVRSIGSKGQGPGEYINIYNVCLDEKNKRLFILSPSKTICYNLNGNFVNETYNSTASFTDIIFFNDKLLLIGQRYGRDEERGGYIGSALYRLSDDLKAIDSIAFIRNTLLGDFTNFANLSYYKDFLLNANSNVYLYFPNNFLVYGSNTAKIILTDTLYRINDNQLVPELKLKFKDDGINRDGNKFINLYNIYLSSRYIFSVYENKLNEDSGMYFFCYDTKTGKGYNMKDGFTDDINQIEEPVKIRPFNIDTEMFYYLHTNMKPDDLEEPNPTLYIGRLKK